MLFGVLVDKSLDDLSVLGQLDIINYWAEEDWVLYKVKVDEDQIEIIQKHLLPGTWYTHFWKDNKDDVVVVFKDTTFLITYSDKNTWKEAIAYGKHLGIPEEWLDFKIDQDT
jgi:hypothetical protein